ncbi:hypothetical protein [Mycolicibacterium litorale]|uniref:Uncharacterized protein n=1 Tax=Mycolicibacterium litorale TaxID=758802 RepID=A0AAD1MSY2_9MYCO|nr:hypothetical protein [Mycolicibacterium litorale]MCV7416454.1 hypothetical protein [Mycolicibacterium litorale]TDY09708.1 hypothetical protein BCL50_1805 [Mycolicibacterium litorale]BBY17654.1 hypothetical protein MLIT_32460 [Mycolicibacterium litorale]
MIAFWLALVVGVVIAVVYFALGVQAFLRVRKEVLALAAAGETTELDVTALDNQEADTFTWKALGAVVASTTVIVLLGVNSLFWYVPAVLAIGSAVAVIAAFLIDRRSTT